MVSERLYFRFPLRQLFIAYQAEVQMADDIHICSSSVFSHFVQITDNSISAPVSSRRLHKENLSTVHELRSTSKDPIIGGVKLIQVDIVPFLTPSQLEEGHSVNWFTKDHLQETLMVMRPVLLSCLETKLDKDVKKSEKSKSCVSTGETVRIACTLKQHPDHNQCLITHFSSQKNPKNKAMSSSSKDQPSFQQRSLHKEKVVAFICPRTSSSVLQLSQLVHADVDKGASQEISKYFLPTS